MFNLSLLTTGIKWLFGSPSRIVILLMSLSLMGSFFYFNIQIANYKSELASVQIEYNRVEKEKNEWQKEYAKLKLNNEKLAFKINELDSVIDKLNIDYQSKDIAINALNDKLNAYKDSTNKEIQYWKKKYDLCGNIQYMNINDPKNKGKVINNETSNKYIDLYNSIFD